MEVGVAQEVGAAAGLAMAHHRCMGVVVEVATVDRLSRLVVGTVVATEDVHGATTPTELRAWDVLQHGIRSAQSAAQISRLLHCLLYGHGLSRSGALHW